MARPLRVVMPALTFVPGHMGGSETYVRELTAALADRDDVEVTVIVSPAAAGAFPHVAEMVDHRLRGGASSSERVRTLFQAHWPSKAVRGVMAGADVVHYPFTVPVPGARRAPWVQTLHDVQHRDLPEMFEPAERLYRSVAYDHAARRAGRVITVSQFCKRRIVERLGIAPERIDVAPLGVDLTKFTRYDGRREPFVFYPATAWPHKNHARLIEAMRLVRRERPDLRLVLTGSRREALGVLPEWVEHRGHVGEAALVELYRSASCLAFPSLYEGFGLPTLEAMASGCPVAASDSGSIPEICGSAAVLYDATDARAIAQGIERALGDASRLVAEGLERARDFAWERCAHAHVLSYSAAGSQ